ncbi:MAG TPA: hypothetical protein VKB86_00415 [Pyrinomonadaceae bacterium]|nr:hypothetical protein [Pyrinomonadaceae bacterium]
MIKRHWQIFCSALLASVVCAAAIASMSGWRKAASPAPKESLTQQGNAEGRLRQGAREKRHFVLAYDDPQWKNVLDTKMLVKDSPIIILGRVERSPCKLSEDGERITIDYQVRVSDVVKGNMAKGTLVTVSVPGGLVRFDDGTTAEFRTPSFRKMASGRSYLLFLTPEGKRDGILITTGGPQGIFELSRDGASAMHFSADFTAPPPLQNLSALLADIRDAMKK